MFSCPFLPVLLSDGRRRRRRRSRGQVVLAHHRVHRVHRRVRRPPGLGLEGEPARPGARHRVHGAEHHLSGRKFVRALSQCQSARRSTSFFRRRHKGANWRAGERDGAVGQEEDAASLRRSTAATTAEFYLTSLTSAPRQQRCCLRKIGVRTGGIFNGNKNGSESLGLKTQTVDEQSRPH